MPVSDIRPVKDALRRKHRAWREKLSPEEKSRLDTAIAKQVRRLWQYQRCVTVLTYVSTPIEVDTRRIIWQALEDRKRVAVPRCVPGTRQMEFYYIHSEEDLSPGAFGVLEPDPERCEPLRDMSAGLCLVPAFSYDWQGFRLGYGKGYYDRFLSAFEGDRVGLCYSACVQRSLPHGRFDRPVELLVTEKYFRCTKKQEMRGESHGREQQ